MPWVWCSAATEGEGFVIWFTADTHFGHRNIVEYSRRPWPDVDAMNLGLVERWNARVQPRDEVWHLGDVSLRRTAALAWVPKLNGRIHLVLGNHDDMGSGVVDLFASVQQVKYLRAEGHRFYLSHYAHRTWPNSLHGSFHLYGHSHGDLPGLGRSMDVGVDCNGYAPISIAEVVTKLSALPATDHHPNPSEPQ